ncbi:hypothetical protein [Lentzea sp. NPDC003310]|uniref:hypothetical protein n=1 Tax=Lentzea sp. NPDC003310 TaxID=3154447 RepID=UPI0033B506F4
MVAADDVPLDRADVVVEVDHEVEDRAVVDPERPRELDGRPDQLGAPGVHPAQQPGHRHALGGAVGPERQRGREVAVLGRAAAFEVRDPLRQQERDVPAVLLRGQPGDLRRVAARGVDDPLDDLVVGGDGFEHLADHRGHPRHSASANTHVV